MDQQNKTRSMTASRRRLLGVLLSGAATALVVAACGGGNSAATPRVAWDLAGVIGSGQSLAVGARADVLASTTPSFNNRKLSLGAATVPPFDPANQSLSLVPLVEPIRPFATAYPSAYPQNIYGETPHTAMASQVTKMARAAGAADYATVHSVVAENGQSITKLRKGAVETVNGTSSSGRAYAATLFEVAAIKRLAAGDKKTYGVGAIVLTHGETDSASLTYEADLVQLWSDYNADLSAITGQTQPIPLIVSQQNSFRRPTGNGDVMGASPSALAQWRAGVDNPGKIICSGPKYQYTTVDDHTHLPARGYQMLGEKYGQVYFETVIMGRNWQPLQPTGVTVNGRVVKVTFHVPVPPLVWDNVLPAPHQAGLTEWQAGKGFELRSGSTPIPIASVAIESDTVLITAGADLPAGAVLGYAVTSDGVAVPGVTWRWGQLRDSDPMVGALTGAAQPNYAVAFEWKL